MDRLFDKNARIALVCKGGPENGPYSSLAARTITEILEKNGSKISGIYACSGSTPTALLGCVGEYPKLCDTWANLKPIDVVGKVHKIRTVMRILRKESVFESHALGELLRKNWDLDKIFSSEALPIKFPAVDIYSSEYVIFSNKNEKHKKWFLEGVLGSMALVPFLQPQTILDPVESELIEPERVVGNKLLLVDGGFMGNLLVEEAMRDGYDLIFLIDIHGLNPSKMGLDEKYHWTNLTRSSLHVLTNTNDVRQYQMTDRINEEIRIKDELKALLELLPQEHAPILRATINRMNSGRLRLGDKNETQIVVVSNKKHASLFNFAKFTRKDVLKLMNAGYDASVTALDRLGLK